MRFMRLAFAVILVSHVVWIFPSGAAATEPSITIWDSDLGYRLVENYYPPFFSGHTGNNYTWTVLSTFV